MRKEIHVKVGKDGWGGESLRGALVQALGEWMNVLESGNNGEGDFIASNGMTIECKAYTMSAGVRMYEAPPEAPEEGQVWRVKLPWGSIVSECLVEELTARTVVLSEMHEHGVTARYDLESITFVERADQ